MEIATVQNPTFTEQNSARPWYKPTATDLKTYALVVTSYLLIGIGIALSCSSFFISTIIHPMIAVSGPALPIVSGITLLNYASKTDTNTQVEKSLPPNTLWLNHSLAKLIDFSFFFERAIPHSTPQTDEEIESNLLYFGLDPLKKAYQKSPKNWLSTVDTITLVDGLQSICNSKALKQKIAELEKDPTKTKYQLNDLKALQKISFDSIEEPEKLLTDFLVHAMQTRPPVGMVNFSKKSGYNCWFIALMQLLRRYPELAANLLTNEELAPLGNQLRAYFSAQLEGKPIAEEYDPLEVRQYCADHPLISGTYIKASQKEREPQADPADLLYFLLDDPDLSLNFSVLSDQFLKDGSRKLIEKIDGKRREYDLIKGKKTLLSTEKIPPIHDSFIDLDILGAKGDFEKAIKGTFEETCGSTKTIAKTINHKKIKPPKNLVIRAKRFCYDFTREQPQFKNNEDLTNIPLNSPIPEKFFTSSPPEYALRSCIIQKGEINSGHYVALERSPEGKWSFCNDHSIHTWDDQTQKWSTPPSGSFNRPPEELLKQGYLFLYDSQDA